MDTLSTLKELSTHIRLEPAEDTSATGSLACGVHYPGKKPSLTISTRLSHPMAGTSAC